MSSDDDIEEAIRASLDSYREETTQRRMSSSSTTNSPLSRVSSKMIVVEDSDEEPPDTKDHGRLGSHLSPLSSHSKIKQARCCPRSHKILVVVILAKEGVCACPPFSLTVPPQKRNSPPLFSPLYTQKTPTMT
jgi:hypothetical protein